MAAWECGAVLGQSSLVSPVLGQLFAFIVRCSCYAVFAVGVSLFPVRPAIILATGVSILQTGQPIPITTGVSLLQTG